MEQFNIGEYIFHVHKWDMEKQLDNERYILPLITGPVVTSMSVGDEPDMLLPAIISGLMDSLASVDLKHLAKLLLDGVLFTPPGKVSNVATFSTLSAGGVDIADLHVLLVKLIMIQYGALLKKGFQGTLSEIMSSLMPESKPSSGE